ncbi:hypothetical protein F511_28868 [Dorcoceras hygrometricum]|uniref:Uncharacterized protein n=1 Tax=Dorcoceras hygrometricum TaxID=472368 RepID=A0A2Z7D6G4_9LAMI|nr:hypothetical protein F511_28868 [Dorcoceras hygrometricum]
MQDHLAAQDDDMWFVITDGPIKITRPNIVVAISVGAAQWVDKLRTEWTIEDKKKANLDNMVKDILYKTLDNNMFKQEMCTKPDRMQAGAEINTSWFRTEDQQNSQASQLNSQAGQQKTSRTAKLTSRPLSWSNRHPSWFTSLEQEEAGQNSLLKQQTILDDNRTDQLRAKQKRTAQYRISSELSSLEQLKADMNEEQNRSE